MIIFVRQAPIEVNLKRTEEAEDKNVSKKSAVKPEQIAYGIDSMREIADIDNHIAFLNTLLKKHAWDKTARKKIVADLAFIEQKKNDETLHLSIVGEFNAGKSTFINALLRDNLLEADIIQGTTVASTVI